MSAIKSIEIKLKTKLDPSHLEVINESHLHSVEPGRESHVRIVAVSDKFESLNLVKRHQLIYAEVKEDPPLKKKVTCGYFSVSAMRICRLPALASTSPMVLVTLSLSKTTCTP